MTEVIRAWQTTAVACVLASVACGSDEGAPKASGSDPCGEFDGSAPMSLACTGLYADWETKTVAPDRRAYTPGVELWSDGLDKSRFVRLPAGATIDASDPNEWRFPVGTKTWKEFSWRGKRIETRYFEKVRDDKWVRATYVWSGDERAAVREDNGKTVSLDGFEWSIPSATTCDRCHGGRRDRILGIEAVSLAHTASRGLTLSMLRDEGKLDPPFEAAAPSPSAAMAGAAATALGWLHVNCGVSCHNASAGSDANASPVRFRLDAATWLSGAESTFAKLDSVRTTFNKRANSPSWSGQPLIVAGDPDASLVVRLAASRGEEQMPPVGTRRVDEAGVTALREWIRGLPAPPHAPRAQSTMALDGAE